MKIAFVAPFGLKHKTTVWARTLPIAQELVKSGHSATILIPSWDSPEDAGKRENREGVTLIFLSLKGGVIATLLRMVKALGECKADIVHIVKPRAYAGLVQWLLWLRHSKEFKLILDTDDWEQSWTPINRYGWLMGHFLGWQEEWGIRHAHGITVASRWLEEKAATVSPQIPRLYLPNGVKPATENAPISHEIDEKKTRVLFFSRYIEVSPTWLASFWRALLELCPTAELIIAGAPVQPWLSAPYELVMAQLPQVQMVGYVPSNGLAKLYASSACAIFPAMPVPLHQAKCSVRLSTTLLHGVPVIASVVGEQSNYGADGAATLVLADASPQEFAKAVVTVLAESEEASEERIQATARMLERYAWPRLTAPMPAFYESILGQR